MRRRPGIYDQRDTAIELAHDMICRGWANAAEAVRTWCGERFAECADDRIKDGVRAHANGDRSEPGGNQIGDDFSFRENDRERTRPKSIEQFENQLSILRWNFSNSFEPIATWQMNDQRIEAGTLLRFKDLGYGVCIERIGGKTVNCFGRQRDGVAAIQDQFHRIRPSFLG